VKIIEAVALSLNIEPRSIRQSPNSWMAGKRLFDESDEFKERLFVVERNLEALGLVNFANVRYFDEDPVIRLKAFAEWVVTTGWELPSEIAELATTSRESAAPELDRVRLEPAIATKQTRSKIEIQSKREAVAAWIANRYPGGIPPGTTMKEISRRFEAETSVRVAEKTVSRALGRA
jgi:hypothetical protein